MLGECKKGEVELQVFHQSGVHTLVCKFSSGSSVPAKT